MFLPLDDVLEEGKHIDLAVDDGRRRRSGRRSSVGTVAFAGGSVEGDAGDDAGGWGGGGGGGGAQDISRPPMFLMEQDYGNSFKMSTCAVDQVCQSVFFCFVFCIFRRMGKNIVQPP